MEKMSIFKKIDAIYTKVTKVIIGDMPHDGDPDVSSKQKTKTFSLDRDYLSKNTFQNLKEKFLHLGEPKDKKSLLYKEVVKQEKNHAKEISKREKELLKAQKELEKKTLARQKEASKKVSNKKETTKKNASKKPTTKTTSKKAITKTSSKKATSSTKASSATTKVKTTTKKPTTKTSSTVKKSPTKKATSSTKPSSTTTKTKTSSTKKSVAKKSTPKKDSNKQPTTTSSKRAEKIALYIKDIKKHYGEVDEAFVAIVVKNLGPSIYRKDAELVSCSDPKELDTVRRNFLIKKLGIDAGKNVLDAAIQDVCEELKGVRTKYRATFYYALAKKFKKESVLS